MIENSAGCHCNLQAGHTTSSANLISSPAASSNYFLDSLFHRSNFAMRIPPLEVILAWPTPNYINPVTRGHSSVVFNAIFIAIVTFIVILRLYLRIGVRKRVGMDDAFLALSYVRIDCGFSLHAILTRLDIRSWPYDGRYTCKRKIWLGSCKYLLLCLAPQDFAERRLITVFSISTISLPASLPRH